MLDHVQKLPTAAELVARIWATAKREDEEKITDLEATVLQADFASLWSAVDVQQAALELRTRAGGLVSLVAELRGPSKSISDFCLS